MLLIRMRRPPENCYFPRFQMKLDLQGRISARLLRGGLPNRRGKGRLAVVTPISPPMQHCLSRVSSLRHWLDPPCKCSFHIRLVCNISSLCIPSYRPHLVSVSLQSSFIQTTAVSPTKIWLSCSMRNSKPSPSPPDATPSHEHLMSYRIARGEQGVLTFEPYKSALLPLWRFRTPEVARKSSQDLWSRFEQYDREDDFVGMDMTRKFIQMVR